jgi:hypothetical protein
MSQQLTPAGVFPAYYDPNGNLVIDADNQIAGASEVGNIVDRFRSARDNFRGGINDRLDDVADRQRAKGRDGAAALLDRGGDFIQQHGIPGIPVPGKHLTNLLLPSVNPNDPRNQPVQVQDQPHPQINRPGGAPMNKVQTLLGTGLELAAGATETLEIRVDDDFDAEQFTMEGSGSAIRLLSVDFGRQRVAEIGGTGVPASLYGATSTSKSFVNGHSIKSGGTIKVKVLNTDGAAVAQAEVQIAGKYPALSC